MNIRGYASSRGALTVPYAAAAGIAFDRLAARSYTGRVLLEHDSMIPTGPGWEFSPAPKAAAAKPSNLYSHASSPPGKG